MKFKFSITDLITLDAMQHTRVALFRVSASGDYKFRILHTPTHFNLSSKDEYGNLWMEEWSFGVAHFAPRYAVDLLTGMVIQGYGFSSGAIRRSKVVIDNASFDYYTTPATDAGYRVLNLDMCGSFVEIRSLYKPLLQLPMFCSDGTKIVRSDGGYDEEVPYTEEDRDYARSFVGTKMLIYLKGGGVQCKYNDGQGISIHEGSFVTKQAKETEGGSVALTVQQFADGQFAELECCIGCDADGEIVYWNVNTLGNIAR